MMKILHRYLLRRDLLDAINRRRRIIHRRLTKDIYKDQRKLFTKAGIEPHIIIDVGAYVGDIASLYLTLFPRATLHAMEPSPDSYSQLSKRFIQNPNVHVHALGISNVIGTAQFHVSGLAHTNSLLLEINVPKETISIVTSTLDAFVKEHAIDHVDILKLDMEGGEFVALEGASALINAMQVDVISLEVRFQTTYVGELLFPEILAYLNERGYTLHNIYVNRENRFYQAVYGDAVFLSDAFRKRIGI